MPRKLADYVGEMILIRSVQSTTNTPVKLIAIDDNGIWIELTRRSWLAKIFKRTSLEKLPIFFVPFARIQWIRGAENCPSLSDKVLG